MIGRDKVKHIIVGFVISLLAGAVAVFFGFSPWLGFVTSAVIGGAKEVIDDHGPGHEEFLDFFATIAGGVVPPILWGLL